MGLAHSKISLGFFYSYFSCSYNYFWGSANIPDFRVALHQNLQNLPISENISEFALKLQIYRFEIGSKALLHILNATFVWDMKFFYLFIATSESESEVFLSFNTTSKLNLKFFYLSRDSFHWFQRLPSSKLSLVSNSGDFSISLLQSTSTQLKVWSYILRQGRRRKKRVEEATDKKKQPKSN